MNGSGEFQPPADRFNRRLGSLRVSVTDRCNMRCRYCMPEEEYVWLPRTSILTFEEIARLTAVFAGLGAGKVRLTGGEPLLRHDLPGLVAMVAAIPGVRDLALTTNGILLSRYAEDLRRAGLHRVTVSLDTLNPGRMLEFARSDRHPDVLDGIRSAVAAGYRSVKINSVIVRGFNDDEVTDLLEFARASGVEARFIEYMDVGGATQWSRDQVVSQAELLDIVRRRFGPVEPLPAADRAGAPAERFRLADGTTFGIIASTTAPFCRDCDRSRLTADGTWFLCLYAGVGINLRDALRSGVSDQDLATLMVDAWGRRTDRGAEERLAVPERGALYQIAALRADPRREMHTRGG
jgi:cyclic pyranopterin phosphate synthase